MRSRSRYWIRRLPLVTSSVLLRAGESDLGAIKASRVVKGRAAKKLSRMYLMLLSTRPFSEPLPTATGRAAQW